MFPQVSFKHSSRTLLPCQVFKLFQLLTWGATKLAAAARGKLACVACGTLRALHTCELAARASSCHGQRSCQCVTGKQPRKVCCICQQFLRLPSSSPTRTTCSFSHWDFKLFLAFAICLFLRVCVFILDICFIAEICKFAERIWVGREVIEG